MDEHSSLIPAGRNGTGIATIANPVTVTISEAAANHIRDSWTADQQTMSAHESGHATVSAILGLPINAVSIKGHGRGWVELSSEDDDQPMIHLDSVLRRIIVVSLAGLAAEVALLGEGSAGNSADFLHATNIATSRLENGLEPLFPPIAMSAWPFGAVPVALANLQAELVITELQRAKAEAERIIEAHKDQVLAFARILFAARRLDGAALNDALRAVGLEPAPRVRPVAA